eukprot:11042748-Lingulodinium_polyedra.AAC.1
MFDAARRTPSPAAGRAHFSVDTDEEKKINKKTPRRTARAAQARGPAPDLTPRGAANHCRRRLPNGVGCGGGSGVRPR